MPGEDHLPVYARQPVDRMLGTMPDLTQALALTSLVGGTLEYAILMRHREDRRRAARHLDEVQATGREALFRAHLLNRGGGSRRWRIAGTRFR